MFKTKIAQSLIQFEEINARIEESIILQATRKV